jgi:orotidine-5'-phosphate decarboxylase
MRPTYLKVEERILSIQAKDRVIVALDVADISKAEEIIADLQGLTGPYKIGLEAISAGIAHELADLVIQAGGQVFWDGKWLDIPNTVAGATKGLLKRHPTGIWAFNVHASGGSEMMLSAVQNRGSSLVLAVTVLTSLNDADSIRLHGYRVVDTVLMLTGEATDALVQGIICSPQEVTAIAANLSTAIKESNGLPQLLLVTPAIRTEWAVPQDQKRPTTPKQAILNGSHYIVVGRPITNPPEGWTRRSAAEAIIGEIEQALEEKARG